MSEGAAAGLQSPVKHPQNVDTRQSKVHTTVNSKDTVRQPEHYVNCYFYYKNFFIFRTFDSNFEYLRTPSSLPPSFRGGDKRIIFLTINSRENEKMIASSECKLKLHHLQKDFSKKENL